MQSEEKIKITKKVIKQLFEHARQDAPLEACGYLAGQDDIVTTCYPLINTDKSTDHFSFDPNEQFAVMRDIRARGQKICVVYHSHPSSPARPSKEDISLAYDPNIFYVIISLAGAKEEIKAFRIKKGEVTAVDLEVIEDARV